METISNARLVVDLSAIRQNASFIQKSHPSCKLIPVLKSDAYGLGMVQVAKALASLPFVPCFAVAQVSEGIRLKESGILRDVLVLNPALPRQISAAVSEGLTLTVGQVSEIEAVASAASSLGKKVSVQIKFETGLYRHGIQDCEFPSLVRSLNRNMERVHVLGAYSHFADPYDPDRCSSQYRQFLSFTDQLAQAGHPVPLRHICDSAAIERYPEFALDAIRIGRRLSLDSPDCPDGQIREAASLQAYVIAVNERKKGTRLGYGSGIVLNHDAVIASIGIGYGDGLSLRFAERNLCVRINGSLCPVIYSFMDQSLVDVTGHSVQTGDLATLFGYDESGFLLSAQEQAKKLDALEGCELTSSLLPRVERIYR